MAVRKTAKGQKSKFTKVHDKVYFGQKWKDTNYVTVFQLARQGMADTAIATALGVNRVTFYRWRDSNPTLQDALDRARTKEAGAGNLAEYVHGRLPAKVQKLWDEIMEVDKAENHGYRPRRKRLMKVLAREGRTIRQQLWLHALINSNFSKSEACRKTNIPRTQVQYWIENDENFLELADYVIEVKKDFVESGLMSLIAAGDSPATVFASKTLLRDRGYDSKVTVVMDKTEKKVKVNMDKVLEGMSTEAKLDFLRALKSGGSLDGSKEGPKKLPPRLVTTNDITDEEDDDE